MSLPVKLPDEVKQDLRALPSDQLRKVAFGWLQRLRGEPRLGQRLDWRLSTGDLRDCRKLYFDERDEPLVRNFMTRTRAGEGAQFRVVYRLLPRDEQPETIQVIAIGRKREEDGEGVYGRAARRLGRG